MSLPRQYSIRRQAGMTLLELIIACAILMVLASIALPVARYSMLRAKERQLRRDLLDIRDAIDRYKDASEQQKIRTAIGSIGYPPDLDTLVKGVPLFVFGSNPGAGTSSSDDKKIRFLRKIPVDPFTGNADWGLRCVSDEPDSTFWCGKNVFDVYSKSQATALDGTKYSDW